MQTLVKLFHLGGGGGTQLLLNVVLQGLKNNAFDASLGLSNGVKD
jgi:hypothetical protein